MKFFQVDSANVERHIKNAWVAALVSAAVTFVVSILPLFGVSLLGFDLWSLIDVALILLMAYGIYKKNRVAGVAMLVYFIISKIVLTLENPSTSGIGLGLVFIYFFFMGMIAIFKYHSLHPKR